VGRNSNRYCLGYSLRAGLVFAKTPDHYIPNFGHKKAAMFGLQLARLMEFLRSAGNFTPDDRSVNWKHSLDGMAHCITSAYTRRAKTRARDARRYVSQRGSVHVEGLERGEGSLH
jgi:hypothetical protein